MIVAAPSGIILIYGSSYVIKYTTLDLISFILPYLATFNISDIAILYLRNDVTIYMFR